MNLLEKIILIAGLVIATGANAQQHGNGGAGVRRSGIAMTFGTANIVVDPEPRTDAEVPYLYETMDFIMQHPALTSNLKQKLFDALRPSELRRYFNIDPKKFGAVEKARLIAEFKRVIPNNNEEILLFAVTDTSEKNTFLLPTFYELTKPSEQMAILVHEAYWILNPDATYADVIRAETSAQNLFENPNDAKAILNFINIFISNSS